MMATNYRPKIERIDGTSFKVQSASNPEATYIVGPNSCTCPDFKYRARECKHIKALLAYLQKPHEHRVICQGCNFRFTVDCEGCDHPDQYVEYTTCHECKGSKAVKEWSEKNENYYRSI